jgi:DNA-binding SARP family transcriptional activator
MDFRILGPLEIWHGDRQIALGAAKKRALMTILVLRANQSLPIDYLVEQLWPHKAPDSALTLVRIYVSQLRKALEQGAGTREGSRLLLTRASGYTLRVDPGQVDVTRFERLLADGQRLIAEGHASPAAQRLREALALWRGRALADIADTPLGQMEAIRLEELHAVAVEERIEADLACGRHAELVGELSALVKTYPLRERLHAQLMLALYRSGRQAEALRVFKEAHRLLSDELGLEPAEELQQLQRAILRADPELRWRPQAATATTAGARVLPTPRQLPPDIDDFTGRGGEVACLRELLEREHGDATAVVVWVISGKPGVGKTVLAVHVAHQVRHHFPHGQLFASLRGTQAPTQDPADVLAEFLRALGVDGAAIPEHLAERARLYRTLLADPRVLVVLDDAAEEAQVRHLLPGSPGSAVLVTSRGRLAGLEGAHHLDLEILAPRHALELLEKVAGPDRVAAEPDAAGAIARLCGRLPLALRVAGAKLAAKPHWRLTTFERRLADEHRRLDELRAGDLEVRASVGLSYQNLGERQRRGFRLLALLPQPAFASWLAAAVLGSPIAGAEELLEELVDGHLLEATWAEEAGLPRYRFHDLLRLFATERLHEEEPPAARRAALEHALRACLDRCRQADALLGSGEEHDARRWFEAEHATLVAAVELAHAAGLWELTWGLALALSGYFEVRSRWDDWRRTHEAALDAAHQAGSRPAQAATLRRLGDLYLDKSQWTRALACYDECLPIFHELGDHRGEAKTLRSLGDAHREQSHWPEALACFDQCLPIFRELGDCREEAEVLRGLGIINRHHDRLDEALANFERCMRLSAEFGDRRWEAIARRSLGLVYRDQGRLEDARACLEQSVTAFRELPDQLWEAYTLTSLGQLDRQQGHLEDARACLEQSLAIFDRLDDTSGEAYALQGLGDVLREQGRLDDATACLQRCLASFRQLNDRRGEGYALFSLALVERDQGRMDQCRARLDQCLVIAEQLDLPRWQAQVRGALGELDAALWGP